MSCVRRVLLCILSGGWLLPLYLGVSWYLGVVAGVQRFHANGGVGLPSAARGTSFPVEEFTVQLSIIALFVACLWLSGAIVFWVWRFTAVEHSKQQRASAA